MAVRALSDLFELVRRESATAISLQSWQSTIDEVRSGIQRALAAFRASLEIPGGEPAAAYRGLVFALAQSGRTDEMRALRIDGAAAKVSSTLAADQQKKPRQYTVWISDDEQRLPLLVECKTEFGDVRAELVSYQSPSFTASR